MSLRARIAEGLGWRFQPNWQDNCAAGAPVPADDCCSRHECDSIALSDLRPGEHGTVSCLQEPGERAACKLAAMGVLPGAELVLVQHYPAYVFRMGHSEFAVDAEMARHIRVHRL